MQISKTNLSRPCISWDEAFDLSFTLKMGKNEAVSAANGGAVRLFFIPNNYQGNENGFISDDMFLRLEDKNENVIGYRYPVSISKGGSKAFSFAGGRIRADTVVATDADGKEITQRDMFLQLTGDNGAKRAYPVALYVEVFESGGSKRGYYAEETGAALFLLERLNPVVDSCIFTDEAWLKNDETSPLEFFGALVQGVSKPKFDVSYTMDPMEYSLTASITIEIYNPYGELEKRYVQEDRQVTAYDASGNVIDSYEGPKHGTIPAASLQEFGVYAWRCIVTDDAGNSGESAGSFEVLRYNFPIISNLLVERYTESVDDDGNPVYALSDEGDRVCVTLEAEITPISGKNAWSMTAYYGPDGDVSANTRELFTAAERTDGTTIMLVQDRMLIPDEISPAYEWTFKLGLEDMLRDTEAIEFADKSGANFSVEPYGAAVGMRSTGTDGERKFEVAPGYKAYMYGGISGVTDYSEGEQQTYGTWIDGRPIYRKTQIINVTSAGTTATGIGISFNMQSVVDLKGTFYRTGNDRWYPISFDYGDTSYVDCWVANYSVNVRSAWAGIAYVTVFYTKSTDSPGTVATLIDSDGSALADSTGASLASAAATDVYYLSHTGTQIDTGVGKALSMPEFNSGFTDKTASMYAGQLLFIDGTGKISPISLGAGLQITNGVLSVIGGGGSGGGGDSGEISFAVDGNGNATISGTTFNVDDDGNATISGEIAVDANGNALI